MSFRTVVITKQSKLSYKNRYLAVKNELEEKYIHLSEIDTIIVDSISVSISSYLLKELSENKINIIFCDEKHNPFGKLKDELWSLLVKNKIMNQALLLNKINSNNYNLLMSYVTEVKKGDKTNREAHAAKVYFNSLFTKSFIRNANDNINAALNYGYSILLSNFNKEIINNGYLTQLGIHHKSEFNQFNLACDLMEPFRPIIDNFVYYNQTREFDSKYKLDLINIFNNTYKYYGKNYTLKDIIKMYTKDTLDCLNENKKYKEFTLYEG